MKDNQSAIPAIPTTITDCGRPDSERRDCTVRAIAKTFDIPYSEAHAKLATLGRKARHGCKFKAMVAGLGLELRPDLSCMTLAKALPEMQTGRYIARIHRHVFAIVDGMVYDLETPKPNCRLKMVYEVKPSNPQSNT